MSRIYILLFLWIFAFERAFAGISVELDVVFGDSAALCRCLYVLSVDNAGMATDTLAVFDSLSFSGRSNTSLFYDAEPGSRNMLSMVDSAGSRIAGKPFAVSAQRTTFAVTVGRRQLDAVVKDYIYPQKYGCKHSHFVFLIIFFSVKLFITIIFVLSSKLSGNIVAISAGACLLGALVDWSLSINYPYRFMIVIVLEYMLIAFIGRCSITKLTAAKMVLITNAVGFGFIAILYLLFVFR